MRNKKYHHGDELSSVVFKMSDKPEDSDTHLDSREEESEDPSKSRSLKSATHKLKAEALRRLQLGEAGYDNEGAKNSEGREGSSHDENVVDTGNDSGEQKEIVPGKSHVSNEEREETIDVTHSLSADSDVDETRRNEGFGKDSEKPSEDTSGDSVVGENIKSNRWNEEGSDIPAHVDGQKDPEVNDQRISKGSESQSEGENVNQGISNKTVNEGSTQGQGVAIRDSRPGSTSSRPRSGKARPGSGSEGSRKGERSKQKPSSRPGSGARSRPGSGSTKVSGGGGQEQQPSSGRPDSGSGRGSRPQSRSKRGAAGNDGGIVVQDESASGGVVEDTSKKDEASAGDATKQTAQDFSQSKESKDKVKGVTPSDNTSEGMLQTVGTGTAQQGQDHHGDKSNLAGSESVHVEKSSAEKSSSDNKSESKLTGDDDKISDDVSPPMNEGTESKDESAVSKQSSDSLSDNKQDSEAAEASRDPKEGELSEETKGDNQTASSSDQQGEDDTKTAEQKDASETIEGKDDSKDSTSAEGEETSAAVKTGEKGESGSEQDGVAAKTESGPADGDKPEIQTDHGNGDQDDSEKSSDKQTAEQGRTDDAAVDGAEEKKADGSEKKTKEKKAKKEGTEHEENMEDEDVEEADKTGMAGDEVQPDKAKQTETGV